MTCQLGGKILDVGYSVVGVRHRVAPLFVSQQVGVIGHGVKYEPFEQGFFFGRCFAVCGKESIEGVGGIGAPVGGIGIE